ncbi:hypothetical protein ACFL2B_01805 [Patescibacteria group bacterium]
MREFNLIFICLLCFSFPAAFILFALRKEIAWEAIKTKIGNGIKKAIAGPRKLGTKIVPGAKKVGGWIKAGWVWLKTKYANWRQRRRAATQQTQTPPDPNAAATPAPVQQDGWFKRNGKRVWGWVKGFFFGSGRLIKKCWQKSSRITKQAFAKLPIASIRPERIPGSMDLVQLVVLWFIPSVFFISSFIVCFVPTWGVLNALEWMDDYKYEKWAESDEGIEILVTISRWLDAGYILEDLGGDWYRIGKYECEMMPEPTPRKIGWFGYSLMLILGTGITILTCISLLVKRWQVLDVGQGALIKLLGTNTHKADEARSYMIFWFEKFVKFDKRPIKASLPKEEVTAKDNGKEEDGDDDDATEITNVEMYVQPHIKIEIIQPEVVDQYIPIEYWTELLDTQVDGTDETAKIVLELLAGEEDWSQKEGDDKKTRRKRNIQAEKRAKAIAKIVNSDQMQMILQMARMVLNVEVDKAASYHSMESDIKKIAKTITNYLNNDDQNAVDDIGELIGLGPAYNTGLKMEYGLTDPIAKNKGIIEAMEDLAKARKEAERIRAMAEADAFRREQESAAGVRGKFQAFIDPMAKNRGGKQTQKKKKDQKKKQDNQNTGTQNPNPPSGDNQPTSAWGKVKKKIHDATG